MKASKYLICSGLLIIIWLIVMAAAPVKVHAVLSPPTLTSKDRIQSVEFVNCLFENATPEQASILKSKYSFSGTDLGIPVYDSKRHRTLIFFGDTFENINHNTTNGSFPPGEWSWNSNMMAVTTDTNFRDANGLELTGFYTGDGITNLDANGNLPSGKHVEAIIEGKHDEGYERTIIPTGGIEINGTIYMFYFSKATWSFRADSVNYGGCVKSTDGGNSWTKVNQLSWANHSSGYNSEYSQTDSNGNICKGNSATNIQKLMNQGINGINVGAGIKIEDHTCHFFTQIYPVDGKDGYIYLLGEGGYRTMGIKLARVLKQNFEDYNSYEYFIGLDSSGNPQWLKGKAGLEKLHSKTESCGFIIGSDNMNDPNSGCGEHSCMFNPYLNKWIITYIQGSGVPGDNGRGIKYRLADKIWGPYTDSKTIFFSYNNVNVLPRDANGATVGAIYGGFILPQWVEENGRIMYAIVSQFKSASTPILYTSSVVRITFNSEAPSSYTVAFDKNNGTGSMPNQMINVGATQLLNANAFTRTGYTFKNWNTMVNGSGTTYTNQQSVTNLAAGGGTVRLYAQWTPNNFTVTFKANDGSGRTNSQSFTYDYAKPLSVNTFTRTGYTFKNWNTNANGSGTTYTNQQSVKNLTSVNGGTVTLYAQWVANTYTVKFDENNGSGSMPSQTYSVGETKPLSVNTFTRTGYKFKNWNTKADGSGMTYTNQQSVTNLASSGETITLYAQWERNTYTVVFNRNNGSGTMSSQPFNVGEAQALSANTFTRKGYTFKDWNTSQNGSGMTYTNQQSVTNLAYSGETITLYAQWTANTYKIHFNANYPAGTSYTGTMQDITNIKYGTLITLPQNQFVIANYQFSYWKYSKDGTWTTCNDKATISNATAVNGNIVEFFAKWQAVAPEIHYSRVTFNANGGTLGIEYIDVIQGQSITQTCNQTHDDVPNLTPTKDGYRFVGWKLGNEIFNEQSVVNSDVTVTAEWVANTYLVIFNSNEGSNLMQNQEFTYGTSQKLTKNGFVKTGYTFKNWNTYANGSGTTYTDQQNVTNLVTSGVLTLYAQWTVNTYSIHFVVNNPAGTSYIGTMQDKTNVHYDTLITLPQNEFKIENYQFASWNTQPNGEGNSYSDKSKVKNLTSENNATVTLYAIWLDVSVNYVDVTLNANGGNVDITTINVEQNSSISDSGVQTKTLPEPTREGYRFDSWRVGNASGEIFSASVSISSPLMIFASWTPISYSVKFNSNGGAGSMENQSFTYGTTQKLTKNSFTKNGFTFSGWNTSSDGSGTGYLDEQSVENLTGEDGKVVALYAIWTDNSSASDKSGNNPASLDDLGDKTKSLWDDLKDWIEDLPDWSYYAAAGVGGLIVIWILWSIFAPKKKKKIESANKDSSNENDKTKK